MKLFYFFLSILLFQNCRSQPATKYPYNKDENSLLWEISGKDIKKPSYLFGTFHLMCKEDISIGKNLIEIVKNADEVYFELDLDDFSATLGALLFMNMKNDTVLRDLYTADQYKKIESYFRDSLQMPMSFMEKIKPLFLQAFLYPKMMTCKNVSGVEDALMKLAKEHKKEIKGLETIAFQAAIFDSIPYKEQAKELLNGIDSLTEGKKQFNEMLADYKSQKLAEIEQLTNEDMGGGYNREKLLDNRNRNWVIQLKGLMSKKGLLIAVGAGHLVGKNGVIELLKKEGYTLRPVENVK